MFKNRKTKNKDKSFKNLQSNSATRDALIFIIKSIKATTKGVVKLSNLYFNLFEGWDTISAYKKFRGTYYADKEDTRIGEKLRKDWELRRAIRSLQKMDYIKINDAKKRVYLTEKGFLEFIKSRIKSKESIWDRKWRMVIFDIPESKRQQRDFLRKQLKWLGFKELQKSVWIFPYDIRKELDEVLDISSKYNFGEDVRFVVVDKVENDKDLRNYFNL